MQRDTLVIKSLNAAFNDSASGGRIAYPSFKQTSGQCLPAGILFLLLLLLNGCTEGQVFDNAPDQAQMVALRFSSPGLGSAEDLTRAETEAPPEALPTGATVRIAAYYRKATEGQVDFATAAPTYQATYEVKPDGTLVPCVVDADGKKTADTANGLTVRGGTYDFYAVSPARPLQQRSGDNKYQISGIQHKEDVMTSFARDVAVSATSNIVVLKTFARKCALVVFNVAPAPGNALPFNELYGTSLTLKKVSTSGASLIAGEDTGITPTGGGEGETSEVAFIQTDFEPVEGSNPTGLNKAKGVILPKDKTAFEVSLTVVRDDETATLSATIDKQITFDPGKRYLFTLEVKNNTSQLLMNVQSWGTIPFNDPSVGSPDPDHPTDPDIDPGTGTTIIVAQWDDMTWTGNGLAGSSPTVRIDDSVLKRYYTRMTESDPRWNWTNFPPFDADGDDTAASHGLTDVVFSDTPSMNGYYQIQVESTQKLERYNKATLNNYCDTLSIDGYTDWRLPTQIELYAMWDKAKGTDMNAGDPEVDSSIFGASFIAGDYWSSSVYGDRTDLRCMLRFKNGAFYANANPGYAAYVRCVRDKKLTI